jgi:ATP-dependent Clp protease ATP-binding subunit ClpC
MSTENATKKTWFDRALAFLADGRARAKERHEERHKMFSPCAEQVLELATQAALSLNHNFVGAEHLLAGILKLDSGKAVAALKSAGLTLPSWREEIEPYSGVGEHPQFLLPIPYTPRSKGLVERAQAKVRSSGGDSVEVEDLLLELLAEKEGVPARAFRRWGIDVEAIKSAITKKTPAQ